MYLCVCQPPTKNVIIMSCKHILIKNKNWKKLIKYQNYNKKFKSLEETRSKEACQTDAERIHATVVGEHRARTRRHLMLHIHHCLRQRFGNHRSCFFHFILLLILQNTEFRWVCYALIMSLLPVTSHRCHVPLNSFFLFHNNLPPAFMSSLLDFKYLRE